MKTKIKKLKLVLLLMALSFSISNIKAQSVNLIENTFFQCALDPIELAKTSNAGYAPNGGAFTPRGDLKVLIIFAGFDNAAGNQFLPGWGSGTNDLPDYVNPATGSALSLFYSNNEEFEYLLFNLLGNEIENKKTHKDEFKIDASDKRTGIYYYRISNQNGSLYSDKIVIINN
ncbi:T9SS type A sorting domain-containing protein [bacterium AH-315-M05]|nr:T9SS type A sorting domain-containing protein [bacterium AH-315-M05]